MAGGGVVLTRASVRVRRPPRRRRCTGAAAQQALAWLAG
jgi:hypothetical protein